MMTGMVVVMVMVMMMIMIVTVVVVVNDYSDCDVMLVMNTIMVMAKVLAAGHLHDGVI